MSRDLERLLSHLFAWITSGSGFWFGFFMAILGATILLPLILGLARLLGIYTIVHERECKVYVLFGKVIGSISEPGIHFLPARIGIEALIVNWLGKCHVIDMRLDQEYLRSQPVNSEEGAPMGIGIWHEMYISDPTAFLFRNTDPRGSLSANVSNSTVRSLSNMPLADMLINRHAMSDTVRREVSPKSHEWGYRLGSVYIRKVHFRDSAMIHEIEGKVVNRLRQVTSAIKQDGANQVSIITSTAERQAAVAFAQAAAVRPNIIGSTLHDISKRPTVSTALFEVLEAQRITASAATLTMVPPKGGLLAEVLAADPGPRPAPRPGPIYEKPPAP
jgi:regulator of protease activity HflC (stomatin/prohibitin superfamily)